MGQSPETLITIKPDMFLEYPEIVNITQMMAMLRIGRVLAYRLVRENYIPAKKIGREYRIQKSAITDYFNNTEEKN
jgi:excisionase family DNA binding protein